jgi:hypothetical protein
VLLADAEAPILSMSRSPAADMQAESESAEAAASRSPLKR